MAQVTFSDTYYVSWVGSISANVRLTFDEAYTLATNKTTLTLSKIELQVVDNATNYSSCPLLGSIQVDGTTVATIDNSGSGKIATVAITGSGWSTANISNLTITPVTVTHNDNGTKSVTVKLLSGYTQDESFFCARYSGGVTQCPFGVRAPVSLSMALTTRPRASSVSATNANFGSAVTITISRHSSSFTHTVKASCAGRTETVMTKSSTYPTVTWTPSVANFAPLITNAMSATATITCETYSGSTLVGTATTTCTLSFTAASVAPSVSISTADPNGYLSTYGRYIVGKSKIRVTLTNTLKYGASLSATQITANGTSYSSSPATTDVISSTSNTSVSAKITDSRNQQATASTSIQIYDYTSPKINSFSVYRCNSDGTSNNSGAYARVNYNVTITALGDHNSKALRIKYKKSSASSYTTKTVTLSSYSQSGNVHDIVADLDSSYNIILELQDDFSTVSAAKILPTASTHINHGAGSTGGIGIGKVSENAKTIEIASDWSISVGNPTQAKTSLGLAGLSCQTRKFADSASVDIEIPNNTSGAIITSGAAVGAKDLVWFSCGASGGTTVLQMRNAAGLTVTAGTNKITIANSSGSYCYAIALYY